MYSDLSGWKSVFSIGTAITFFINESRVTVEDVNQALRECRTPEMMAQFGFASDLTKFFAGRVVELRTKREVIEREKKNQEEYARERKEHPERFRHDPPATSEQISRLAREFASHGRMPS